MASPSNQGTGTEGEASNKLGAIWTPQIGPQANAISADWCPVMFYGGGKFSGKALDINTPIPTPNGWKDLIDIKPGDFVFNSEGNPVMVLAVTPPMYSRPCYKLTFSNNQEIIADESHLWLTQTDKERTQAYKRTEEYRLNRRQKRAKRGKGKRPDLTLQNQLKVHTYLEPSLGEIRTTLQIFDTLTTRGRINHTVNLAKALNYPEKNLPITPYILGAWLGDGHSNGGGFTTADLEMLDIIKAEGYEIKKWSGKYAYGIHGIQTPLKALGLINNKHIPLIYLEGSYQQRLDLLHGLMDTDGSCDRDGSLEFTITNKPIALGFQELLNSLGIRAIMRQAKTYLYGKRCADRYRFSFTSSIPVFRLKRKLLKQKQKTTVRSERLYITNIEPFESIPVKCIQVASTDGMFLASRSMIPTHNSDFLLGDYLADLETYREHWQGIIFRRSLTEFTELKLRANELFPKAGGKWQEQKSQWIFPNFGTKDQVPTLRFKFLEHLRDIRLYEGHSYPWIGVDELGDWEDPDAFFRLITCNRYGRHPIPNKRVRATGNPGGRGHLWIKEYFVDPAPKGSKILFDDKLKKPYMFILGTYRDNKEGLKNDPDYANNLNRAGSPALIRALKEGDFSVVAGAFFEFDHRHIIQPFRIPHHWARIMSMDWGACGEGDPFSIGWWAVSDGTDENGTIPYFKRGTMIRYREYFGKGLPRVAVKDVAKRILELEEFDPPQITRWAGGDIKKKLDESGPSIFEMFADNGVYFARADMNRAAGWLTMRDYLKGDKNSDGLEIPRVYCFASCIHSAKIIPTIQYNPKDANDIEEVNDDLPDEWRYGLHTSRPQSAITDKPGKAKTLDEAFAQKHTLNDLWKMKEQLQKKGRR